MYNQIVKKKSKKARRHNYKAHQNEKRGKLFHETTEREKSSFKKHEETKFDHIPRLTAYRKWNWHWSLHLVEGTCNVRVTIISYYVMHSCAIQVICFPDHFIPRLRPTWNLVDIDHQCSCWLTKSHSPSIGYIIRALEIASNA